MTNNLEDICQTVNLMLSTLLDRLGRIFNVNKRNHAMGHVITLWTFGTSKSYAFGKITKRCLIDSTL